VSRCSLSRGSHSPESFSSFQNQLHGQMSAEVSSEAAYGLPRTSHFWITYGLPTILELAGGIRMKGCGWPSSVLLPLRRFRAHALFPCDMLPGELPGIP
jgi:hypothetical protein